MQLIRLFSLFALLLVLAPVHADENASTKRLTSLLSQADTLTGRFSQLSLDASGTQLQETSGELALKRPGQFRWHTDEPMEQLLVSNGEKVWLYDPDLQQVTIQQLDQRLTHTPALLLSGDVSTISENFEVSHKEVGDVIDFTLRPKARDTLFDSLRLSFRGGVINDMQLIDSVGQRTNILFMGVKMNEPLKSGLFQFEIPEGADVISE
ncbi:outer membrane lipoprotein chaperone LolA [Pseudomonas sp. S5(2021)]|jgi:outer membrane lipoprotein carrier protein|uniref:Outer-membrane lipoprotein carrier protein n=1 Tax=Stutzerimonas balearica TaxID=74829 RepID=A0A9X7YSR5_9GAMM|nr:outer membrane lipoprotein chaperone LolA [Stutzerimonas balearica]MBB60669.1 outer membrane lipoprotein chaperone LolA [Pseudomonas sp.]MBZ5756334.1 outer membrane lipoprotein chaperone LolA [Pseudomonas sp. S5(2021)]MBS4150254.1 outer membrane lipoprotein chaperone LolA [Stutzerimonas balearica]OMG64076.1 outer-membrane lipoprotein carrier protein [Stutzerimonas balearica]QQN51307.1 outer membrane lipoprotein chaperone LolA [Stutzerimonas balearica]